MKVKFTDIDIKTIEIDLKAIDQSFDKLKISLDRDIQNKLEYSIYTLANKISDIQRVYIRNKYLLQQGKDEEFKTKRQSESSDLSTTKSINKDYAEENNYLSLQEMIVERLENRKKSIVRLANHINDMRIADLADAKRQDFTNK
jgi:hypothetical protein